MKAMSKRRNLLTVITPKSTYSRMLIENLLLKENEDYQNEARMTVSFKEMIIQKQQQDSSYSTGQIAEKPAEVETSQSSSILYSLKGAWDSFKSNSSGLISNLVSAFTKK